MVVPRMLYYSMQHFKFIPRYRFDIRPDGNPAMGQKDDSQDSRLEPTPTNQAFRRFPLLKFLPGSSEIFFMGYPSSDALRAMEDILPLRVLLSSFFPLTSVRGKDGLPSVARFQRAKRERSM